MSITLSVSEKNIGVSDPTVIHLLLSYRIVCPPVFVTMLLVNKWLLFRLPYRQHIIHSHGNSHPFSYVMDIHYISIHICDCLL